MPESKFRQMFNFAEREKKKRRLKRLRGGDAEPIDLDAEIDLYCPKHGLQRVEHARFEKITKGENGKESVIFARSKDHEDPLRFTLFGEKDSSIESESYPIKYSNSQEGSKRLALFMAAVGLSIILFQQIWLMFGWEFGEAIGESLWFNRMLFILIGAAIFGGGAMVWFSSRTNYHYLPLVCVGEHEGDIHQCAIPGRESFQEAMKMFYDSEKNTEAIELFANMRQNFDEKIEELNDEIDEQKILREEAQEKNMMRQGMEAARAIREDISDDYMTVKDVVLWTLVGCIGTGLFVFFLVG